MIVESSELGLDPGEHAPVRGSRVLQRRRELADAGRPVALPDRDAQVDDVRVRRADEREPVAEADGAAAARLAPVEADAARAARDAERSGRLAVAGAQESIVHDDGRVCEELALLHRELAPRGERPFRAELDLLEDVDDAVRLERETGRVPPGR